jgi:hypothetical protein
MVCLFVDGASLCASVCECVSACECVCARARACCTEYINTRVPACLPACLPAYLPARPPAYLPRHILQYDFFIGEDGIVAPTSSTISLWREQHGPSNRCVRILYTIDLRTYARMYGTWSGAPSNRVATALREKRRFALGLCRRG